MIKLNVKHESGGPLHKMTHATKNEAKFTGKGGFKKNFGKKETPHNKALDRMNEVRNRVSKVKGY